MSASVLSWVVTVFVSGFSCRSFHCGCAGGPDTSAEETWLSGTVVSQKCRGCGATGGGRSGSPFPPCASPRVLHGQGRQRQPKRARGHGEEAGTTKADQPVSATKCPPALLTSPGNGSLAVYAGPLSPSAAEAPRNPMNKCNPLHSNDLRPPHYPNPRKKRNPCATTTYTQSSPGAAPFFTEDPKPAQKRKPLLPNTLRPYFRLLPRAKHTRTKSPASPPPRRQVNTP